MLCQTHRLLQRPRESALKPPRRRIRDRANLAVFGGAPRVERVKLQAGENPCSGALQLALAARSLREEPSIGAVLVNSLGAGGNQIAVVLAAP